MRGPYRQCAVQLCQPKNGRRVMLQETREAVRSVWQLLKSPISSLQELNGTTPTANLLTGGLDERFTRTDSTGTFDYLTDALGSTISLTNSTGASQVQYSYDPYGSMSITGSNTNSYAYTGREFDGLGTDYYRPK